MTAKHKFFRICSFVFTLLGVLLTILAQIVVHNRVETAIVAFFILIVAAIACFADFFCMFLQWRQKRKTKLVTKQEEVFHETL